MAKLTKAIYESLGTMSSLKQELGFSLGVIPNEHVTPGKIFVLSGTTTQGSSMIVNVGSEPALDQAATLPVFEVRPNEDPTTLHGYFTLMWSSSVNAAVRTRVAALLHEQWSAYGVVSVYKMYAGAREIQSRIEQELLGDVALGRLFIKEQSWVYEVTQKYHPPCTVDCQGVGNVYKGTFTTPLIFVYAATGPAGANAALVTLPNKIVLVVRYSQGVPPELLEYSAAYLQEHPVTATGYKSYAEFKALHLSLEKVLRAECLRLIEAGELALKPCQCGWAFGKVAP